jgi:aminotransferase
MGFRFARSCWFRGCGTVFRGVSDHARVERRRRKHCEYDRRRKLLVAGLNRLGLSTVEPRGAFYAFPNIQASGMDDEAFCQALLEEEHVAVVPGSSFGPGGTGFARACYATEYSKIEEALHRMEKFMNRYG